MREKIEKYKWLILFGGFILLNIGSMVYQNRVSEEKIYLSDPIKEEEDNLLNLEEQVEQSIEEPTETEKGIICKVENKIEEEKTYEVPIYICGEVKKPGVYYVHSDAIVNDIVAISGGFTDEANPLAVNLASPIQPNEKIIIPKQGEEIDKSMDSYDNIGRATISLNDDKVHINTASKEEFMTLNGIGAVKAEAIIAYRQEKGGFNSIEEVKNISGIGEKTFEKIKPFITIE